MNQHSTRLRKTQANGIHITESTCDGTGPARRFAAALRRAHPAVDTVFTTHTGTLGPDRVCVRLVGHDHTEVHTPEGWTRVRTSTSGNVTYVHFKEADR